ncbi:NAD(P)-dependent oxidoreductase [Tropicimonas marinistellae]|uniref:NAD(P)-dependent oxidoreductase n=1 Tax=Tropicimonas marinistellae TaxID=1739787 RepID=UPI00082A7514|nr:DUF1932 domain-containing protein [Tropicimonas marinistellae]
MALQANASENQRDLALLGFGEAARAYVRGWQQAGVAVDLTAYDVKTDTSGPQRQQMQEAYAAAAVVGVPNASEAVSRAEVVFSFVTADQALVAARSAQGGLRPGCIYFDCNSCAPRTKRAAAELVADVGGNYLDVAVMAPVHPRLNATPVLVSGAAADRGVEIMRSLGMPVRTIGPDVGQASSVKLVRSIMIKGMEALSAECLLAGRTLGVEDVVLASLSESFAGIDWNEMMHRNLERMMVHGRRRAAEMREACAMVEDLGLPGRMAQASANWQQQIGEQTLSPLQDEIGPRSDRVLAAVTGSNARRRA